MIKSALILVLVLALAAGAFFSKPSAGNFVYFYGKNAAASSGASGAAGGLLGSLADAGFKEYAKKAFTYQDRVLWANEVDANGKVVYTGAFGHWFVRDPEAAKPPVAGS